MTNVSNDILQNAFFIINHYEESTTEITNLKLQKLLYLAEALYMAFYRDENQLFNEKWLFSEFGPINKELNDRFNEFGNNLINITEEEVLIGNSIPDKNRTVLTNVITLYGDRTYLDLLSLTTSNNTPYNLINNNKELSLTQKEKEVISKNLTRNWFINYYNLDAEQR